MNAMEQARSAVGLVAEGDELITLAEAARRLPKIDGKGCERLPEGVGPMILNPIALPAEPSPSFPSSGSATCRVSFRHE